MTTTESTTRPRGRPREFDREAVIEAVMRLFWEKGFEATAMSDVVEATGLNKSSLYNAFGSKDQLFLIALDRYLDMRSAMLDDMLSDGSAGLADIEAFLGFVRSEAFGERGRLGCLAINTSTELANVDDEMQAKALRFREEMRAGLLAALSRAETAGEIDAGTADRYAAILLAFLLSLPVLTRSGADEAELEDQFAAVEALLADWRVST